jgi:hypothetical protein
MTVAQVFTSKAVLDLWKQSAEFHIEDWTLGS